MRPSRPGRLLRAVVAAVALASLPACSDDEPADGGAATTASTGPASSSSSTTVATGPIELRGDGLGIVKLGDDANDVVAALAAQWGPPDVDTGWADGRSSRYGVCPGMTRGVEWNSLTVLLTDGDSKFGAEGRPHFFSWAYAELDPEVGHDDTAGQPAELATPEGLSAGSTVVDLRRVYGDRLEVRLDVFGPAFRLKPPSENDVAGFLSGTDETATVNGLLAGEGCGE